MTITVIHEVRWLPNDIGSKLDNLLTAIQALDAKVDELALAFRETNETQIRALANEVKVVREKLQTSIDSQTKGE